MVADVAIGGEPATTVPSPFGWCCCDDGADPAALDALFGFALAAADGGTLAAERDASIVGNA